MAYPMIKIDFETFGLFLFSTMFIQQVGQFFLRRNPWGLANPESPRGRIIILLTLGLILGSLAILCVVFLLMIATVIGWV